VAQNWAYAGCEVWTGYGTLPTSLTLGKPNGTQLGDLLVLVSLYGFALTATLPSGFAHVTGSPQTFSTNNRMLFAWKIAGGSEPASYTLGNSGGSGGYEAAALIRYTGIAAAPTPVSAVATATATTIATPTVTTTAADSLVLRAVGTFNAASLSIASGTVRALQGAGGDLLMVAELDKATVGATGTDVATANTSNAMQSIVAAFLQTTGPVTHSVSGAGSFSINSPPALSVVLSGIPSRLGTGKGNPVRYFELGNISIGSANGQMRNYFLEHATELVLCPFATATEVYYSFPVGVTATISELVVA
jgi:hypothetical protein